MRSLPSPGEPTFLRPGPEQRVVLEGAKGRFLPPTGAVFPWSAHWQQMDRCGALAEVRACPPWRSKVYVQSAPGAEARGPAEGEVPGKVLPEHGAVVEWSPHWSGELLAGRLVFPRRMPQLGELVSVKARGPVPAAKEGDKPGENAWRNQPWSEDLLKQLLAGQIEFPQAPRAEKEKE